MISEIYGRNLFLQQAIIVKCLPAGLIWSLSEKKSLIYGKKMPKQSKKGVRLIRARKTLSSKPVLRPGQ